MKTRSAGRALFERPPRFVIDTVPEVGAETLQRALGIGVSGAGGQ